jgi:hypothetical protein
VQAGHSPSNGLYADRDPVHKRPLGVKVGPNWLRPSWSAPEHTAVVAPRPQTFWAGVSSADSYQLVEQRLGVLQIGGIEALGEPAVNRGEQVVGLLPLASLGPEPGEAGRGAEFPGSGAL